MVFFKVFRKFVENTIYASCFSWDNAEKTGYFKYLLARSNGKRVSSARRKYRDSFNLVKDITKNGLRAPLEAYVQDGHMFLYRGYRRFVILHVLGYDRVPILLHKSREIAYNMPFKFVPGARGSIKELAQKQFVKYGEKATDKYWVHGYIDLYDKLFSGIRKKRIKILELGLGRGASLLLWRQAFPKAIIYGLDRNRAWREMAGGMKRTRVFRGKQQNAEFLRRKVVPNGPYDIIIDDCGHLPAMQKASFDVLYHEALSQFGYYIVEDCHLNFGKSNVNLPVHMAVRLHEIYDGHAVASAQSHYNLSVIQKGIVPKKLPSKELLSKEDIENLRKYGGHL